MPHFDPIPYGLSYIDGETFFVFADAMIALADVVAMQNFKVGGEPRVRVTLADAVIEVKPCPPPDPDQPSA